MGTTPVSVPSENERNESQYALKTEDKKPYIIQIVDGKNIKYQVNDIEKQEEQKKQEEDQELKELIVQANQDFEDLSKELNKLNTQFEELQNDLDKDI